MPVTIRAYRPSDRDSLYDVCLRTGDAGADASDLVTDPRLFGEVYVGPYLALAPQYALVADDGQRAAGYALAVLDTAAFHAECEQVWWPPLRRRYPPGSDRWTATDRELVDAIHHPPAVPDLPGYPSHLHIDLLAHLRGAGLGQRMLHELFARLADDGSPGVHLVVDERNKGAQRFYRRLGFVDLGSAGQGGLYQGLRLPVTQPGSAAPPRPSGREQAGPPDCRRR